MCRLSTRHWEGSPVVLFLRSCLFSALTLLKSHVSSFCWSPGNHPANPWLASDAKCTQAVISHTPPTCLYLCLYTVYIERDSDLHAYMGTGGFKSNTAFPNIYLNVCIYLYTHVSIYCVLAYTHMHVGICLYIPLHTYDSLEIAIFVGLSQGEHVE